MLRRALHLIKAQESGWQIAWLNPDIAIGSVWSDDGWHEIYAAGVRAVVDLCDDPGDLGAVVRSAGMRYLRLCLRSLTAPGQEELHIVTSWTRDRNQSEGPVMVRVVDDSNNDGMLACASLIRSGFAYDSALRALERVRPQVELSYEQAGSLLRFEAEITASSEH